MLQYIVQFSIASITEGSVYALIGLGLAIIHRTTEVMFFAQGTLAMVSGVTFYALLTYSNIPLAFAALIALIVTLIVALASQWLIVLPLLDRGATPLSVSIVIIGEALLLDTGAMVLFGKDPLAVVSFSGEEPIKFLGASIVPQEIWIVCTLLAFSCLFYSFFRKTWTGKAMTGLGENPLLAKAMGFPVRRLFTYSFVFGALTAGAAGLVSAPLSYTGYWIGTRLTVKGFVAAAVGGLNNPLGAVVGGLLTGFFESFGAGFISSGFRDLITIVLLLLVLLWRPQGLMGER
jgi:branched-chain amino acid transport system permease protein